MLDANIEETVFDPNGHMTHQYADVEVDDDVDWARR